MRRNIKQPVVLLAVGIGGRCHIQVEEEPSARPPTPSTAGKKDLTGLWGELIDDLHLEYFQSFITLIQK